jgi:hypothetical protein
MKELLNRAMAEGNGTEIIVRLETFVANKCTKISGQ